VDSLKVDTIVVSCLPGLVEEMDFRLQISD